MVSFLLQHHANPNLKDRNGETVLCHSLIKSDASEIIAALLEFGGNTDETSKNGITPLILALTNNKLVTAALLINWETSIHSCDEYQRTTLMFAVK